MIFRSTDIIFDKKPILPNGYIIISNHLHFTDFCLIAYIFDNVYTIIKSDLFSLEIPYLSLLFKFICKNCKLIEYKRNDRIDGKRVQNILSQLILNHNNVLIFPEGTTSLNTKKGLLPFKKGIFKLAYDSNIPIVPVVIHYTDPEFGCPVEKKFKILDVFKNNTKVITKVLEPQYPNSYRNIDEFMNNIRDYMENYLKNINNN